MTKRKSGRPPLPPGRPPHDNILQFLHFEALALVSGKTVNAIFERSTATTVRPSNNNLRGQRSPIATIKRQHYATRKFLQTRYPLPEDFKRAHPRSLGPYFDHQIRQHADELHKLDLFSHNK
jgi:hypothetical protein